MLRLRPGYIRTFIVFLMLAGFLAGGCASPQVQPDDADSKKTARLKFQEALNFGKLNMKEEMIATLLEVVSLDPENLNYRMHLGNAYVMNDEVENGEKTYQAILDRDKDYKPALLELGRLAMRRGNWKQATHYFNEILSRPGTPMPHQVYNYLAISYYRMGMYPEAEGEWLKALAIKEYAPIRLNLALAYRDQERFQEARASLEKAIDLDPKLAQAHYEIAILYLKESWNQKAEKHFNEVLRLAPQSQWAQSSREYLKVMQTGS